MKNLTSNLLLLLLFLVLAAAFVGCIVWGFDNSEMFRVLFCGQSQNTAAVGQVNAATTQTLADRMMLAGRISMYIFAFVNAFQIFAFFLALSVLRGIKRGAGSPELKLKQLKNADIFFDIPLYIGLFGTILSFVVMTFSPQSARLIAYSSTLIGIIFSLVLKVTLLYPLQRRLTIAAAGESRP